VALSDTVRAHAAEVSANARHVRIDLDAAGDIAPGPEPELDPVRHFLEGTKDEVAAYLLTLDAINFGSGWFPTLNKRVVDGRPVSGYFTIAMGLTDRFRADGPYSNEELRAMRAEEIASVTGQQPSHELMALFAQALRQLGVFLGERTPMEFVAGSRGSAQRLAESVARMPMWGDTGFYKRAQILANDLALAGVAQFRDLDTLTIFADNVVPHVLRTDGVLVYSDELAQTIDSGTLLGSGDHEIRAAAVHACAHIATQLGVPERTLDTWLWNRGQDRRYKARPRHRTRTVFY
jgi:Potential Queuosine, Q, salvage protein family